MKKAINWFLNIYHYKLVLMIMLIPCILVDLSAYSSQLLMVMMGWGAILCLWDLFTKRRFFKAKGMLWLIGFLVTTVISVAVNFNRETIGLSFSTTAYMIIALLLLYPDHTDGDRDRAVREVKVISYEFVVMTAIFSTVSFIMYIVQYSRVVPFGDSEYIVGWSNEAHRLFGIYGNTGYMLSAVGIALTTVLLVIHKSGEKKMKMWTVALIIYSYIANFLSMCMENAKGAFISLAVFAFVAVFFILLKVLRDKNFGKFKSSAVSIIAACLAAVVLFGSIYGMRPLLAYLPTAVEKSTTEIPGEEKPGKIDIDRELGEEHQVLTGRPTIWKFGLEKYSEKPFFGYGPDGFRDVEMLNGSQGLRHFHNLIVQSLVSVGTVGSIFIFAFLALTVFSVLRRMLKKVDTDDKHYYTAAALLALAAMYAVNSMSEVTILFLTRFSMFMFWMFLGYLRTLTDGSEKGVTDRWMSKLDGLFGKVFNRKKNG